MGPIGMVMGAAGSLARGVGSMMFGAGRVVGSAMLNGADSFARGAFRAGKAGGKAAARAGNKAMSGADFMANDIVEGMNRENRGINMVGNAISVASRLAGKMGRYEHELYEKNPMTGELVHHSGGLKFTKLGMGTLLGAGALSGIRDAHDTYLNNRVGQIDPQKYTATPDMRKEDYSMPVDNGGATGDLVFALHQNRHG